MEIKSEDSEEVFDVRIDFESYAATIFPLERDDETGKYVGGGGSEPEGGMFGVYEKGADSFLTRITRWFLTFFTFFRSG